MRKEQKSIVALAMITGFMVAAAFVPGLVGLAFLIGERRSK